MFITGCAGVQPPRVAVRGVSSVELEATFGNIVAVVAPSVVSLRIERTSLAPLATVRDAASGAPSDVLMVEQTVRVNGSGMVLRPDGLILTNEHVVQDADRIRVVLSDGRAYDAEMLATDTRSDLAVLRISARGLTPVRFATPSSVMRGQWSIALGNPYGFGDDGRLSASVGIVANTGRNLPELGVEQDRLYTDMIQTTAVVNPGNSGGPLLNLKGEVIGIVTAMYVRTAGEDGMGFAIALSPETRARIAHLERGESVAYGYLGVSVRDPAAVRESGRGALVVNVEPEGPADRAGIQVGDHIRAYAADPIEDAAALVERVNRTMVGQTVAVTFERAGREKTVNVRIGRRAPARVAALR